MSVGGSLSESTQRRQPDRQPGHESARHGNRVRIPDRTRTVPSPTSQLRCWKLATREEVGVALTWPLHCDSLDISPDGEWLLVGGEGGRVTLWWAPALMEARPD